MVTVNEFYEKKYLHEVLPHLKKHGRADRLSLFRKHVLPALGPKRLREVSIDMVRRLLDTKLGEGLSTQRVKHVRNSISSLFRHAREERYFSGALPTDFRWRVRMVRVRRRGSINEAQARLLREELSYLPVVAALIRFLCLSGTRISEALGLRWRNCNLEDHSVHAGELVIPRRAVALVEAWTAGEYTTLKRGDAHERIIPLTPKLYEAFAQFKQRDKFTGPDDPVFASTTGKPLSAGNYLMKHLKPAIAKVNARIEREGLDVEKLPAELSWHWLRHTNASLTDQEGMTAVERQKVLGHGAASMTMHYSHAEVEHMREGLERVEQRLEGAGEPPKKAPAGAKVVEFPATRKQA